MTRIPASLPTAMVAVQHPGTAGALLRLAHGHLVAMGSANQGVAYDRPRWPGRAPTGELGHAPGALTTKAGLGHFEQTVGPTAIRGDSADRLRESVSRLGAAGSRMPYPVAMLANGGGIANRVPIAYTPAASVMRSADAYTDGHGYALRPAVMAAPGTPASRSTVLTPGATSRTAMPFPALAPALLVDTPAAGGGESTGSAQHVFMHGATTAMLPEAPPTDYVPTGANGDPGGTRIVELAERPAEPFPSGPLPAPPARTGLALGVLGALALVAVYAAKRRR